MSLLSSSIKATSYLIALQGLSRILTFTLNQLILRYTTPSVFGFATIQLELFLNTVLFLCREGCRISIQRLPTTTEKEREGNVDRAQEIINLSWLPVSAGFFLASILSYLYIHSAPVESTGIPYFTTTVVIYAVSTILELFTEPYYNTAVQRMMFKVRASCEGLAVINRCLVNFAVSLYGGDRSLGALAFALGQLAYSVTLMVSYRVQLPISISPKPRVNHDNRKSEGTAIWISGSLMKLSITNTIQGLLKHVLTEGDKIMISWFSTNEEQGSYGLAANYGGLVARIVLQPIEEASRSYFANLLPQQQQIETKAMNEQDRKASNSWYKETAELVIMSILRFYILVSILLISVAPKVITDLLPVILKHSQWSKVTTVLSSFCYYIPLLAVNGILESFVTATASPKVLRQQGVYWIPCSIAFGVAGYAFRGYGATGLVYANCVNLALRIIWALKYLRHVCGRLDAGSIVPSKTSITAVVALAGVMYNQDLAAQSVGKYLIKIVTAAGVTGLFVLLGERSWAMSTYARLKVKF